MDSTKRIPVWGPTKIPPSQRSAPIESPLNSQIELPLRTNYAPTELLRVSLEDWMIGGLASLITFYQSRKGEPERRSTVRSTKAGDGRRQLETIGDGRRRVEGTRGLPPQEYLCGALLSSH